MLLKLAICFGCRGSVSWDDRDVEVDTHVVFRIASKKGQN